MKIFVLSPNKDAVFTLDLIQKLEKIGDVQFETTPKSYKEVKGLLDPGEKIIAADPDFFGWKFPKEFLDDVSDIKGICLQTTSFSWIDVGYAKQKNIPVVNLRGFSTEAVAEYALMLTLGAARKLAVFAKDGYKQDFVKHQGIELRGKMVGIIGLGRIGKRYAELMTALGAQVMYWSNKSHDDRFASASLENIFAKADVIFPALAYNETTATIITDELLKSMKPRAMFVSIVHKVYNHDLVLKMTEEGRIFSYAFEEDNGNPAAYKGNVLALPSVAWATNESMRLNGEMWTDAIVNAAGEIFPTRVNS